MLDGILATALLIGAVLGAAALTPSCRRVPRVAALILGLVALLSPFVLPTGWVFPRFVALLFGVLIFARIHDLLRRPSELSFGRRVWFMLAFVDVRRAKQVPPGLDRRELVWLLAHALVIVASSLAVFALAPRLDGASHWLLRWGAGVPLCYAIIEFVQAAMLLVYRALGLELPRINDFPILSTTLVEFWGRRWNRVVAQWLRDYFFYPLARRKHATLGVCAAFGVSTLVHFWVSWVPLGLWAGISMASYFVVHAIGLLLERALRVAGWPPAARRLWTGVWIFGASPLFVEPALRIIAAMAKLARLS